MPIGVSGAIALGVGAAGVGASLIGSSQQAGAISDASDAANARAQQAIAEAKPLYQPYIDQGGSGLKTYADLTGVNGPDAASTAMAGFQASPGYQYQVQQGLRAVDAGAASKGMLRSGATLKAEQTLGNNLADQDFGNYMTRLNTLATFGQNAVNGYSNVMTGQANNQQSTLTSAGGQLASIYGNEASGVANALGNTYSNLRSSGALNSLFPTTGGNPTGGYIPSDTTSAFAGAGMPAATVY